MHQKAASAAFTYLVYHPEDTSMLGNLKYYSEMTSVDKKDIINYEAKVLPRIIYRFPFWKLLMSFTDRISSICTYTERIRTIRRIGKRSRFTWKIRSSATCSPKKNAEPNAKVLSTKGGTPISYQLSPVGY